MASPASCSAIHANWLCLQGDGPSAANWHAAECLLSLQLAPACLQPVCHLLSKALICLWSAWQDQISLQLRRRLSCKCARSVPQAMPMRQTGLKRLCLTCKEQPLLAGSDHPLCCRRIQLVSHRCSACKWGLCLYCQLIVDEHQLCPSAG